MNDEIRPGYFKDRHGEWQKDRRRADDRRAGSAAYGHHDRRTLRRRKSDIEFIERETKEQIQDALEEFAAEHSHHHETPDSQES